MKVWEYKIIKKEKAESRKWKRKKKIYVVQLFFEGKFTLFS